MTGQTDYWNQLAPEAHFTHPLRLDWIAERISHDAPILDFGCGYGRMLTLLRDTGFTDLTGIDPSSQMIARARSCVTSARLDVSDPDKPHIGYQDGSFRLVLLVAVLTCIPDSDEQRGIIAEIDRVLADGGLLYMSDFLLQSDERNRERYDHFESRGLRRGVFEIDDGRATVRHHDESYLRDLLSAFDQIECESFELRTMMGNPAIGTRMLLRKRPKAEQGAAQATQA